jgi:hypothetical protein
MPNVSSTIRKQLNVPTFIVQNELNVQDYDKYLKEQFGCVQQENKLDKKKAILELIVVIIMRSDDSRQIIFIL